MRPLLRFTLMLLILSAVAPLAHCEEVKSTQTFAAFWTQFKAAVAKKDKDAVAAMTKFPVEIGENVSKEKFLKMYPEFFGPEVQRCFAKKKPIKEDAAPGRHESYSLLCGEEIFLFEKVDGKYLFTGIGMND